MRMRVRSCPPCEDGDMKWYSTRQPEGAQRSTEEVEFGPGFPSGSARRLIGDVDGKRVLELGSGAGNSSVAMARAGAKVIAVEPDAAQIDLARELCAQHEVRIEQHHSELADLAFLRADGFDLAVSCYELSRVGDIDRVFRQVHRILRPEAVFVFSLPHPIAVMQAYDVPYRTAEVGDGRHLHRIGDIIGGLGRANFRLEALMETDPEAAVPSTLLIRVRKVGV